MEFEMDDTVRDMNLEARLEKELMLHGFKRRDFTNVELAHLRAELEALQDGNCSILNGFWSEERVSQKADEDPGIEPEARFSVGDRVWVTENVAVNGIPGVGTVRKVEKEWIDLGDQLKGYWEITYYLRNMRTSYTENNVFSTELEALAAMASDFRKQSIGQAAEVCRRLRALGMSITTKELLTNIAESV